MSEYQRSPQSSYRTYIPHGDRTSAWVSRLPRERAGDPTMPPSDTESAIYSSDSDAESSRSVPPRFVLRFPDGREQRVSDDHYSNPTRQNSRSRAASGPVNNYGPPPHHHPRSLSMQSSTRVSGALFRPHSTIPPQEEIRVLPPPRSMTPGTAGYINSRSHRSRTSSVQAPKPRRAYDQDPPDVSHYGQQDKWSKLHGPPQAIKFSHSHPPSRHDMPTRDYSANTYRSHPSSKLARQPVMGSPSSHMSQLTKENTIANSHSRIRSRGAIEDNWSVIDEDEEWEREQQRTAYRRGRASSQSSSSPPLTHSRSRTTSSSSRSGYQPSGPQVLVSFVVS